MLRVRRATCGQFTAIKGLVGFPKIRGTFSGVPALRVIIECTLLQSTLFCSTVSLG